MKTITDKILTDTILKRPSNSHKGMFGRVCLVGGNYQLGGAIIMAAEASVYSGAGLNTIITDSVNFGAIHTRLPEAMVTSFTDENSLNKLVSTSDTVVIGPGLGLETFGLNILKAVFNMIQPKQTLLIDSSAITMIAENDLLLPIANLIFTPHQMEWQRLSGIPINSQDNEANEKVRDELNAIVVLKSHRTRIYTAEGTFINSTGTPAQATGGMGDALAGIIGGFTAQFTNREKSVLAAVYAHSDIADHLAEHQYIVLPTQIIHMLPAYMHDHQNKQ